METEKTLCSFCDEEVKNLDINRFIICCDKHKDRAIKEEELFFTEYPNYTKWNTEVPKGRLIFK